MKKADKWGQSTKKEDTSGREEEQPQLNKTNGEVGRQNSH